MVNSGTRYGGRAQQTLATKLESAGRTGASQHSTTGDHALADMLLPTSHSVNDGPLISLAAGTRIRATPFLQESPTAWSRHAPLVQHACVVSPQPLGQDAYLFVQDVGVAG
jgi:hypothetical protein